MNIKPAILPPSFEDVIEKLSRIEGLANMVQIDLCDGIFGREKTWSPQGTETLPSGFLYEFDVMMNDWKLPMMHSITIGATSIVAHVDLFTDEDMETLISVVAPRSIPLGISVSNDKTVEFHAEMIRKAKALYSNVFIQVMGIKKIGEQGQFFDDDAVGRVAALKQQFGDVSIQVDGGMKPEQTARIIHAGADTVVIGSFIFGSEDAGGAIEKLELVGEQ